MPPKPSSEPSIRHQYNLPGFTLPLNHDPAGDNINGILFKTALNSKDIYDGYIGRDLTPLREFIMLRLMNTITDKPEWNTKVFDDKIVEKWKTEIGDSGADVTEKMKNWIFEELRYKAEIFRNTGMISVYNGDVVKSDSAVPLPIEKALRDAVSSLEKSQKGFKDYHPHSDDKVVNLVHPSLFPLVYGRSRILGESTVDLHDCLTRMGNGEAIAVPPVEETKLPYSLIYSMMRNGEKVEPFSKKFQWLPCDVAFGEEENCHISSYINNLHPQKNKDLYSIIQVIISKAIPLWNMTLTPLKDMYREWYRIAYDAAEYKPVPPELEAQKPEKREGENRMFFANRRRSWERKTRIVVQPEPGDFKAPPPPEIAVDLRSDYRETGLQVIVKLANIELTPEKPEYDGGSWHVEGQMNEHICATALYYYENVNITPSRLAFRQGCSIETYEINYEQDRHEWLWEVFGCRQNGPGVQEVGDIECREGRLLTFPNTLQHCVSPFELQDPTKPGHRKILALFLVDPNIRVISTAHVPPQRKDWWDQSVDVGRILSPLPAELQDEVLDFIGDEFPISLEEAKALRLELMEERAVLTQGQAEAFTSRTFSLCEH